MQDACEDSKSPLEHGKNPATRRKVSSTLPSRCDLAKNSRIRASIGRRAESRRGPQ
jgi:hypothetical protein